MIRGLARGVAALVVLLGLTASLGAQVADKAKVGESVKADLSRLAELERTWYEKNRTFTSDLRALGFTPASGASITMSYASARSWSANATHPSLAPTTCIIVVSQPAAAQSTQPFCIGTSESKQVAGAASAQAGAAKQQPVVVNRGAASRRARPAAPVPMTSTATLPARAPSRRLALSGTRAAGGAGADSGVTEAVTPAQFTERLDAFVASALEMTNAKMPEVARDPYENTAEYQARVAEAFDAFQRREAEFYEENTRTFIVSMPAKGAKYDADREVVDFTLDPITLPTTRTSPALDGIRLSVECYTRPVFWCGADNGMQYDGTDLWRVNRATARSANVLESPLTMVARFVVGRRDGSSSPAVSLISMELQSQGKAISRWQAGAR